MPKARQLFVGVYVAMGNFMLGQLEKSYSPREKIPLAGYALTTLIFNALLVRILRSRVKLDGRDILLLGVATHKLSRIITKDAVTSFLRAPFTRYDEPLGY